MARQVVHLPTSTSLTTGTEQNKRREDQGDSGGTRIDSNVVVQPQGSLDRLDHPGQDQKSIQRRKTKATLHRKTRGTSNRSKRPVKIPLDQETKDLIDNDIRKSTKKLYRLRQDTFRRYCRDIGCEPETAPQNVVLNFLGILISTLDYSYQSVAGFRSAISEMHKGWKGDTVRDTRNVHRIMKAMFLRRPQRPKYSDTWNPETWLRYLATLGPSSALSLIQLSEKLTALIALETISRLMRKKISHNQIFLRSSSLAMIDPDPTFKDNDIIFKLTGLEKQTRIDEPGKSLKYL